MSSSTTRVLWVDYVTREQTHGGVNRYVNKMLAAFHEFYNGAFAACTYSTRAPAGLRRLALPNLRMPGMYRFRLSRPLEAVDRWLIDKALHKLKPSLVFSPFYGPIFPELPQIFVVYDLILELFTPQRKNWIISEILAHRNRCYQAASALICISENTRRDLLRYYPSINPSKVLITHLGVEDSFFESAEGENVTEEPATRNRPYFLYVGRRGGYKNFLRLLEMFGSDGLGVHFDLRVVGPNERERRWSDQEKHLLKKYSLYESVSLEVIVGEKRLRELYRQSIAFVFPSEYEGFGLPVLEAMASGTIVVASNASSIPEVGGDVALYFDPRDAASLAAALHRASTLSDSERKERREAGVARAKAFSWIKCQEKTIAIVERVLADRGG